MNFMEGLPLENALPEENTLEGESNLPEPATETPEKKGGIGNWLFQLFFFY